MVSRWCPGGCGKSVEWDRNDGRIHVYCCVSCGRVWRGLLAYAIQAAPVVGLDARARKVVGDHPLVVEVD